MFINIRAHQGEEKAQKWQKNWSKPEIKGMMTIMFWRPINMKGPV